MKEWKAECAAFYKEIGKEDIKDSWGRFQRVLGLQRIGVREWDFRKPARAQREGLTLSGYEHD